MVGTLVDPGDEKAPGADLRHERARRHLRRPKRRQARGLGITGGGRATRPRPADRAGGDGMCRDGGMDRDAGGRRRGRTRTRQGGASSGDGHGDHGREGDRASFHEPWPCVHRYSTSLRLSPQAQLSRHDKRRHGDTRCKRGEVARACLCACIERGLIGRHPRGEVGGQLRERGTGVSWPGAEHRCHGLGVAPLVVKRADSRVCRVPGSRVADRGVRRRRGRAARGRRLRGGEQRSRSRSERPLLADVILLVDVVAAVVDQGEALVGVRLLCRDAGLGECLDRRRATGLRRQQVTAARRVRGGQPRERDDEGNSSGNETNVEHSVGASAQPA